MTLQFIIINKSIKNFYRRSRSRWRRNFVNVKLKVKSIQNRPILSHRNLPRRFKLFYERRNLDKLFLQRHANMETFFCVSLAS